METVLKVILTNIVDNVEELSNSKFSGVHDNGTNFRVHLGAFVPVYLQGKLKVALSSIDSAKVIGEIISTTKFNRNVEWDSQSLWVTISK